MKRAAALLSAALLCAGCASAGGGRDTDPFGPDAGTSTIQVQVINGHAENVTVYAVAPALRERLGQVTARTRRTYTLEWDPSRRLEIELQFTRGARCTLGPYNVEPSVRLDVEIPASLDPRSCD